jgi:plastocyanin
MKRFNTMFITAAVTLAAAVGCGGSGGSSGYSTSPSNPAGPSNPTTAGPNTVTLTTDLTFAPASLDVSKGTTVTFKWTACADGGYGGYATCASHSVAFDDGVSSPTQSDGTFSRTFNAAGTFKYHCAIHGSGMSGQINVKS